MCHREINFPLHTVIHPHLGSYAVCTSVLNLDYIIKVGKIEDGVCLHCFCRLPLIRRCGSENETGTLNINGSIYSKMWL